jgi:hypothetical protein
MPLFRDRRTGGNMSTAIPYLKTPAVARLLGVPYWRLWSLIRWELIEAPAKDSSGDYVWLPDDVERAQKALVVDRVEVESVGPATSINRKEVAHDAE